MKEQDKNKLSVNCLLSDRRATMVKRAVMLVWALSIIIFFADSSVFSQVLTERAAFAGGCFWCMEATFEETEGVIEAVSGYTGGETIDPSYEEVSAGKTGHYEAVEVEFNPTIISYAELLKVFWQNINPTDSSGQFYDRGGQYETAIFYSSDEQKLLAEQSKEEMQNSGKFGGKIVTKILPMGEFYPAEEYHQDYYRKNPIGYLWYHTGSGREEYMEKNWSGEIMERKWDENYEKPAQEELKEVLTPLQYEVTQENGTEMPFQNKYWDNKKEGIYVDIVSREPLFSSTDKFDSGTGWPSFSKPLEEEYIVEKVDRSFMMVRTEVRSRYGDSHLGHLFTDGPAPAGLRYCINSAALRFITKEDLEEEGYGQYLKLF